MVKRLLIKLIIEVGSSLTKSFIKAYQQTAKNQAQPNKFSDFLNQTMQAANLTHKPMSREEAFKILNLTPEKANAEIIIQTYWRQFHKNDPIKGGSFYLQSVLLNAKNEIMKDFPDANEAEILKKLKADQKQDEQDEIKEKEEEKKQDKQ